MWPPGRWVGVPGGIPGLWEASSPSLVPDSDSTRTSCSSMKPTFPFLRRAADWLGVGQSPSLAPVWPLLGATALATSSSSVVLPRAMALAVRLSLALARRTELGVSGAGPSPDWALFPPFLPLGVAAGLFFPLGMMLVY